MTDILRRERVYDAEAAAKESEAAAKELDQKSLDAPSLSAHMQRASLNRGFAASAAL
jgi:hypothetical protein